MLLLLIWTITPVLCSTVATSTGPKAAVKTTASFGDMSGNNYLPYTQYPDWVKDAERHHRREIMVHDQTCLYFEVKHSQSRVDMGITDIFNAVWNDMYKLANDHGLTHSNSWNHAWHNRRSGVEPQLPPIYQCAFKKGQFGYSINSAWAAYRDGGMTGWNSRDLYINVMWKAVQEFMEKSATDVSTSCVYLKSFNQCHCRDDIKAHFMPKTIEIIGFNDCVGAVHGWYKIDFNSQIANPIKDACQVYKFLKPLWLADITGWDKFIKATADFGCSLA